MAYARDLDLYTDNVLVIGDSILKEVGHIRNAIVRAYRGDTIEDIKNHILHGQEDLLNNKRIVAIHVGTNDLYSLTVEEMLEDLEALVKAITNKPGSSVWGIIVSTIIPRPKDYWTTQMKIKRYNKEVKNLEITLGFEMLRTWRPFSRKNLPRRFTYKFDALHPSKKGATRLSQYLAKQLSMLRKHHKIARNKRAASKTIVTKKPKCGYGYPNERLRRRTLYRPPGEFPKEPTYGSTEKDIHRPKSKAILRRNTRVTITQLRRNLDGTQKPVPRPDNGDNISDMQSRNMPKAGKRKNRTLKMKKRLNKVVKKLENIANTGATGQKSTKDIRVIELDAEDPRRSATDSRFVVLAGSSEQSQKRPRSMSPLRHCYDRNQYNWRRDESRYGWTGHNQYAHRHHDNRVRWNGQNQYAQRGHYMPRPWDNQRQYPTNHYDQRPHGNGPRYEMRAYSHHQERRSNNVWRRPFFQHHKY